MMRRIALFVLSVFVVSLATGCGKGGTPAANAGSVSFSAGSLTFASTSVGASAAPQTLTLTNGSGSAITITSVVISDNRLGAIDFSQSNTCGASLAAGASCTVTVTFTPSAVGTQSGTVAVVDSASNSPQTAALSGTATAALSPIAALTPPDVPDFGTAVVGVAAATQTLTLSNSGTAALTITSITFSGTNASDFSQTNTCGASVAIGGSCTIVVTFTPTAVGARAATLTVTDNASNGTTQNAALTGTGVATATPTLTVAPASLTFASGAAQTVTVTNTGATAVTISGITITGTNPTVFAQTNTCGSSVPVNGSCTISVTFAPTGSGSFTANLNVADNATGSPQTVALSGTAAPVATFSPTSLTFTQTVLSTTTAAQTITLTNTGTASMTGIAISLGGTSPTKFAQTNTCGATLAVNASCAISVTFTPTASGVVTATVSVADNAAGSPQTVTLTGNGPGTAAVTTTLVTLGLNGDYSSIYSFIDSATSTIDMTMYEDTDTIATTHFKAAADRGVKIRIIFDTNGEKSNNTTAYNALSGYTGSGGGSISVVWANTMFADTHEKSIVVDAAIPAKAYAGIFTANMSSQYYSTSRDFLFYENDANDVAAIETTFNSDFSNGGGTKTTYSPSNYVPVTGDHLVWSSTNTTSPATLGNARAAILALINGAT